MASTSPRRLRSDAFFAKPFDDAVGGTLLGIVVGEAAWLVATFVADRARGRALAQCRTGDARWRSST
jgi:hypothetical protein